MHGFFIFLQISRPILKNSKKNTKKNELCKLTFETLKKREKKCVFSTLCRKNCEGNVKKYVGTLCRGLFGHKKWI